MVTVPRPRPNLIGVIVPALAAAGVALALTTATMLHGVAFWDTGELQAVAPLLGTAHPTGFPTYVLLGWLGSVILRPLGEPALRMNLLSALCTAAAAGLTAVLVHRLTHRSWIAMATGVLLATTPIVWSVGTHAETHSLHLALVSLLLVLLVDWERLRAGDPQAADRRLVAAAITFGLSLGNHSLTLLLIPGIILYLFAVDPAILARPRLIGACLLGLTVTLVAVYAELPLRAGPFRAPLVYGQPDTLDGFWYIVLAEQFRGSLLAPFADLGAKLAALIRLTNGQLGPLALLVPFGFVATAIRQPRYALLTAPTLVITCFFAASYVNAQIERYYLGPALIALTWIAILAGMIVDGIARLGGRAPSTASTVAEIVVAVGLVVAIGPRLPARWSAVDLSREHQAVDWVDRMLDERISPPGSVIVSWWSYSTPLWYEQRVEGRRPDISIIDDRTRLDEHLGEITDVIEANLGSRPVIVIQDDLRVLATVAEGYRLTRLDVPGAQPVYRVDGALARAGPTGGPVSPVSGAGE